MDRKKLLRLAALIAILTLGLILLGGFVRATGAGLACPDWPLCYDRAIPKDWGGGVLQEVGHRYLAAFVSVLTLLLTWFSYRSMHVFPRFWHLVIYLDVILVVQIIFGGLTVTEKLLPWVVTTHLGLGTVFFQMAAQLARGLGIHSLVSKSGKLIGLSSFVVFLQIIIGGFVASSGAASVCPDLLTCTEGVLIPESASGAQILHMLHRGMALLAFGLVIATLMSVKKLPKVKRFVMFAHHAILSQIGIGLLVVYTKIHLHLVLTHLFLAQLTLYFLLSAYVNRRKEVL